MSLTSYLPREIATLIFVSFSLNQKKMMSVSYFWEDLCNGNFAISLKLVM